MIAELVQQAKRLSVNGREPFKSRPIHWLIDLDADGAVLGFTATTKFTTNARGLKEQRGKRFLAPANYLLGSPNQHNWRPDFLTGPADELFFRGIDGQNPVSKKRRAFWELIVRAKNELPQNATLKAIWRCLRTTRSLIDLPLAPSTRDDLECFRKKQNAEGETIGFRVAGVLAHTERELHTWWSNIVHPELHAAQTANFNQHGGDAFQDGEGRLTNSSPCVFGNVPLASFNGAPFSSYGLGDETLRIRLDTAEQAAAALNTLQNDPNHRLSLGDQTAIFWATHRDEAVDCSFVSLLEESDPLAVADFLKSVWGPVPGTIDQATFQVAILEAGTGRFALRSWDSCFLGEVDRRYRAYFEAIRLPGANPTRLGALAAATIAKSKKGSKTKPASTTYNAIFQTAWSGTRLPHRLLEAAVTRQCVELAKGCDKKDRNDFEDRLYARTALIKLYFHSNQLDPDKPMNESTHDTQDHPAYLCGRVLALLDKIHNAAHGKSTASSPAGRFYGSASSTPALVFPRLCKLARVHLEKVVPGLAYKLEHGVPKDRAEIPLDADFPGLAGLVSKFDSKGQWPRTLSLEEQGRFAIGFYYERTRKWPKYRKGANPKGDEPDTDGTVSETSSES